MNQKTNTDIHLLIKTDNWKSKYPKKTNTELAFYSKKDLEIKNFAYKLFIDHGIVVDECKLNFFNNALCIFISYHQNFNPFSINIGNKTKTSFTKTKRIVRKGGSSSLNKTEYQTNQNFKINSLITKFIESLINFNLKTVSFFLVLHQKNNNIKQLIDKKNYRTFKKILVNLRRYAGNDFFREGVNTLFISISHKNSVKLLTEFIATWLQKTKRHTYFLKFIKNALVLLNNLIFSKIKGIKIKIKGKLNDHSRAKNQTIKIAGGVPVLQTNSNIIYSEKIAYTTTGTLGGAALCFYIYYFIKICSYKNILSKSD